jgi:hypothetical protein
VASVAVIFNRMNVSVCFSYLLIEDHQWKLLTLSEGYHLLSKVGAVLFERFLVGAIMKLKIGIALYAVTQGPKQSEAFPSVLTSRYNKVKVSGKPSTLLNHLSIEGGLFADKCGELGLEHVVYTYFVEIHDLPTICQLCGEVHAKFHTV